VKQCVVAASISVSVSNHIDPNYMNWNIDMTVIICTTRNLDDRSHVFYKQLLLDVFAWYSNIKLNYITILMFWGIRVGSYFD